MSFVREHLFGIVIGIVAAEFYTRRQKPKAG